MSTARRLNKDQKRFDKVVNELTAPLSSIVSSFRFIDEKGRCYIPSDFENSVEIANAQYNNWATKFNRKSRSFKARFNVVRTRIATDIAEYELSTYKDLLINRINEIYGLMLHEINDYESKIEESYINGSSISEASAYINSLVKK